jgi:3-oxoadipate enol-lactonase
MPTLVPVVFTHAFPLTRAMWRPQLDALATGYHAVAYDVRGFGRSPAGDGQYTLELMVDDLLALLDERKIDRAVLIGLSMGGYITLRAAERAPDRIRALVLAGTRSEADSNEAKIKRAAAIKTVKEKGVAEFAEGFLKTAFAPSTSPATLEEARRLILSNSPTGICGALLALASRTDTTAFLPRIKVPTLVLVGEHDTLTPPADARALAGKIPGAELHVLPGAAHISNMENPTEFNRHLLDFLRRLP